MSIGTAGVKAMVLAVVLMGHGAMAHARGFVEEVYVARTKTNDDRAVITRSTGETYIIEKGHGCISLWRYEGSRVLILYPRLFLGLGSKLLIPEANQHCSIWTVTRGRIWNDEAWSPMFLGD